jgi:hypothetical protein
VGPRAGLDAAENRINLALPGIEGGPSSPSLYRLSYPKNVAGIKITISEISLSTQEGPLFRLAACCDVTSFRGVLIENVCVCGSP